MTTCTNPDHYPTPEPPNELSGDPRLHVGEGCGQESRLVTQSVIIGDCVEVMRGMEPESIDAIVTDPPYGLEFMGRDWDRLDVRKPDDPTFHRSGSGPHDRAKVRHSGAPSYGGGAGAGMQVWHEQWARAALRVLKPGGHLLAFGGTRTFHRLACGIEDAGFEIRDCLSWLYGSGFPKSLDVSKAIDKAAGAEREVVGPHPTNQCAGGEWCKCETDGRAFSVTKHAAETAPATDLARQWDGWGTALKPSFEPCVVARKPLRGTVAANVTRYGTGALNIDAGRIGTDEPRPWREPIDSDKRDRNTLQTRSASTAPDTFKGRWPANVALDEEAAAMLDAQSGERGISAGRWQDSGNDVYGSGIGKLPKGGTPGMAIGYGDSGGASRFFYTAKASRSKREAWGRLKLDAQRRSDGRKKDIENPRLRTNSRVNDHPTVKPLALMEWLIKLVTPPGGVVLDPFCGSGSTLVAARRLNVRAVGIEQDERSAEIARQRIQAQWEVNLL